MNISTQKRLPHGITSLIVLDALVKLHAQSVRNWGVSRAALLDAVRLPETTVDDRLRTLVKDGKVRRVEHGRYEPIFTPRRGA